MSRMVTPAQGFDVDQIKQDIALAKKNMAEIAKNARESRQDASDILKTMQDSIDVLENMLKERGCA
jgi:uncharacterized membrane protein